MLLASRHRAQTFRPIARTSDRWNADAPPDAVAPRQIRLGKARPARPRPPAQPARARSRAENGRLHGAACARAGPDRRLDGEARHRDARPPAAGVRDSRRKSSPSRASTTRGSNALLGIVKETPRTAHSLLLVGHNPGLAELAALLIASGDVDARQRLIEKFPTAALAVIDFALDDWAKLHPRGRPARPLRGAARARSRARTELATIMLCWCNGIVQALM